MFTCGWCGTHFQTWKSQCDSCGGRMPPPPGMDAGPEPPPPPRKLPKVFAMRVRFTRNWMLIAGLVCLVIFLAMINVLLDYQNFAAAFLPVLFLVGGIGGIIQGVQRATRVLDAFRNGRAVKGKIASVREDKQTTMNNKHPWNIVYTFESGGHHYEGKVTTFETDTANRLQGGPPVWVLVVEGNAERNTVYPPIH
jgi:hypothetical protein